MTKIKVFNFEVCNSATNLSADEINNSTAAMARKLSSPADIEMIVNKFIQDKNVTNIQVTKIDARYHNNGRYNTIWLCYSITYTVPDSCKLPHLE